MNRSVSRMRSSGTILRKGESMSLTASACRSVLSKIGSEVELVKSARTMESVSVSACAGRR